MIVTTSKALLASIYKRYEPTGEVRMLLAWVWILALLINYMTLSISEYPLSDAYYN